MNIVYGGSFNPPTVAHERIIKLLLQRFNPEHIIIMPVGTNYYHKNSLASNSYRIKMLELLTLNFTNVIISTIEMDEDYQGTYHTLKKLSKTYNDLVFVMGADNLLDLDKWISKDKLLKEFSFLVFERNDIDLKEVIEKKYFDYKEHFTLIDLHMKVSSSSIRDDIENNKEMLTKEVYDYIKENHLYERN